MENLEDQMIINSVSAPTEDSNLTNIQNIVKASIESKDYDRGMFYLINFGDILKKKYFSKEFLNQIEILKSILLIFLD